jgi:hypothetical protein
VIGHALHVPRLQLPWAAVGQLQAASVVGLRIISPAVLRMLLQRTVATAEQSRGSVPHPYSTLSCAQGLQLLEYCCSDLTAADEPAASSAGDGAGAAAPQDAAGSSGGAAAAQPPPAPALPPGVPEAAVAVVGEMFGTAGLAALGGLANLQQRLAGGMDDVLNAVMDAMAQPGAAQQQQQQGAAAGAAAAGPAAAAAATGRQASTQARARQQPAPHQDARASSTARSSLPVNLARVASLRGLPIPTAAGSIAVLGKGRRFVYPDACSPPPPSLLLPQQQVQFVSQECVRALAWLLRHPEVRAQLGLELVSVSSLAHHLSSVAATWRPLGGASDGGLGSDTLASSSSGRRSGTLGGLSQALAAPGAPRFPAEVVWDDGAAGGPSLEWLGRLWRVLLHTIAAAPAWEASGGSGGSGGNGSGGAGAGVPGSAAAQGGVLLRSAAQRARGLVDVIAAEIGALDTAAAAGAAGAGGGAGAAGTAGGGEPGAVPVTAADVLAQRAQQLWQPLLDWPLLPLADGRLLKLRHRELVFAVLPDYLAAAPAHQPLPDAAGGDGARGAGAQPLALQQPWAWLLPALCAAGQPVLDPRFSFVISTAAGADAAAAAGSGESTPPPALDPALLFGPLPLVGRPPFLGPLVRKLAAADAVLGGLDWSLARSRPVQQLACGLPAAVAAWDSGQWLRLFELLAAHPPRDLQPDGVRFLRRLPMFPLVQASQQPQQPQPQPQPQQVVVVAGEPPAAAPAPPAAGVMLVALGDEGSTAADHWLLVTGELRGACSGARMHMRMCMCVVRVRPSLALVREAKRRPHTCVCRCRCCCRHCHAYPTPRHATPAFPHAGVLALPSMPPEPQQRMLQLRPGWGELYSLLGLEPTALGDLLRQLLLPHLRSLSSGDRAAALEFIRRAWQQRTGAAPQPLSADERFVEALKAVHFLPAAAALGGAAAAAAADGDAGDAARHGAGMLQAAPGGGAQQSPPLLFRASQLFDPTVPLFAAVLATMHGAAQAAGAQRQPVLFPATPYDGAEWQGMLRALGLQHKVTRETFTRLAEHVAAQAAALAAPTAAATGARAPHSHGAAFVDVTSAEPAQLRRAVAGADALLAHLKSRGVAFGSDRPFWQHLSSVRFVPATLGVPGGRAPRHVFACFAELAQQKDWPLVWSVQPLLSDGRAPAGPLRQQLGMRSPPPVSVVLQHLHTVSGLRCRGAACALVLAFAAARGAGTPLVWHAAHNYASTHTCARTTPHTTQHNHTPAARRQRRRRGAAGDLA